MKKKILIIEDEPALRYILAEAFSDLAFEVHEAQDGDEGLAIALREKPDLVIADALMPHTDGITMIQDLRDDAWGKSVPVLLFTNLPYDAHTARELHTKLGVEYIGKSESSVKQITKRVQGMLAA